MRQRAYDDVLPRRELYYQLSLCEDESVNKRRGSGKNEPLNSSILGHESCAIVVGNRWWYPPISCEKNLSLMVVETIISIEIHSQISTAQVEGSSDHSILNLHFESTSTILTFYSLPSVNI